MHYIIDGYNLLFRMLTEGVDLQEKRQNFIKNLNKKVQLTNIHVTIVFDSNERTFESLVSHYKALAIQFTSKGVTADDWIIDRIKRSTKPENKTVVTSDKSLSRSVKSYHGKTETVEQFVSELNQRYKNKVLSLQKQAVEKPEILLKSKLIPLKKTKTSKTCDKRTISLESNFENYLKTFEDTFEKEYQPKKVSKKIEKEKKHLFPKEKKEDNSHKDPNERWLEIFEALLKKDQST